MENAIAGTSVRVVVVTGVGDLLKRGRGMMVNFALRHIRRAVPPWRLPEATPFNRAIALGLSEAVEFPPVSPTDVAFLQYTGGTTGVPKGAMLTHRNMIANLQQTHAWLKSSMGSANELFVTALPLYHVFALTVNCFVPLMIGANNLLIPNPRDVRAFVKAMRQTPFTVITGVNTLFNMLLNDQEFLRLDFSRLELAVAGGMALQRAVAERWKAATGKPLIEGYGLTETSPIAACNPLTGEDFNGTIGLPMPSTDIAIRDREGRELPLGEPGELCIRGPQVMSGYWKKPDETAKVMTEDGFLRTGDIARMDARGYLTIVDRQKDMIIVSGFNVYPNEIEDVVMTHPGVQEVGAVGVPDLKSGEAVKIVVVRKDAALTEIETDRPLPQISDRLQDAAPCRVPRYAAAHRRRQDPAPRLARGASTTRRKRGGALNAQRARWTILRIGVGRPYRDRNRRRTPAIPPELRQTCNLTCSISLSLQAWRRLRRSSPRPRKVR